MVLVLLFLFVDSKLQHNRPPSLRTLDQRSGKLGEWREWGGQNQEICSNKKKIKSI